MIFNVIMKSIHVFMIPVCNIYMNLLFLLVIENVTMLNHEKHLKKCIFTSMYNVVLLIWGGKGCKVYEDALYHGFVVHMKMSVLR